MEVSVKCEIGKPVTASVQCDIDGQTYRAEFPYPLYMHAWEGRVAFEKFKGSVILVVNGDFRVTMQPVEPEPFIYVNDE